MRTQELNLLVVFDAIMAEGSITKASKRLAMTQPAVSNAVSRMRLIWKDELFVKEGRGIQPTLFAQNLWQQIREPLQDLNHAVNPEIFDPATSTRTFRVALASVTVDIAWLKLRMIIEKEAPSVNVHAIPYTVVNGVQVLVDAEVDMVIGDVSTNLNVIRNEFLFNSKFVCVMRKEHPLTKTGMTIEEFASAEHILVSLSGDTMGYSDQVLSQYGLRRRIAMTVNHFSAIPHLLENSDLIAVVPPTAIEEPIFSGRLAVIELPIDIPGVPVASFWHARQERDDGLLWLRTHLNQIIREYAHDHYKELGRRFCCPRTHVHTNSDTLSK